MLRVACARAAAFPAQILGNFATAPGVEPHECADPSRGACAGAMSRRWLSTRGVRGFAAHAARAQPRVGAPAVEPPKNSTWLSSAPAGTTEHTMRSRDEGEPQVPSEHARNGVVSYARDQPPVGGHRGGGQARSGVDLVLLVSLVGWVCSSSAQKEAKKAAAVLSVSFLDTPFSGPLKSWLVVARGASA